MLPRAGLLALTVRRRCSLRMGAGGITGLVSRSKPVDAGADRSDRPPAQQHHRHGPRERSDEVNKVAQEKDVENAVKSDVDCMKSNEGRGNSETPANLRAFGACIEEM